MMRLHSAPEVNNGRKLRWLFVRVREVCQLQIRMSPRSEDPPGQAIGEISARTISVCRTHRKARLNADPKIPSPQEIITNFRQ